MGSIWSCQLPVHLLLRSSNGEECTWHCFLSFQSTFQHGQIRLSHGVLKHVKTQSCIQLHPSATISSRPSQTKGSWSPLLYGGGHVHDVDRSPGLRMKCWDGVVSWKGRVSLGYFITSLWENQFTFQSFRCFNTFHVLCKQSNNDELVLSRCTKWVPLKSKAATFPNTLAQLQMTLGWKTLGRWLEQSWLLVRDWNLL